MIEVEETGGGASFLIHRALVDCNIISVNINDAYRTKEGQ